MTQQEDNIERKQDENKATETALLQSLPVIKEEEDRPFPTDGNVIDSELDATEDVDNEFKQRKFLTGTAVLFVAMGLMCLFVVMDVVFSLNGNAERTLINSAFEAFKLIAVTVLGYLFGSSNMNRQ